MADNNSDRSAALLGYLERLIPHYVDELGQLCAIDTKSGHAPGINETNAWIRRWVSGRNWELRDWPDDVAGDGLVVTARGAKADGLRLMLLIHTDTVYPVGTAAERPVRREGDKLLGPGTIDDKSGLLSSLYAMAALTDLDLLGPVAAVSLVCTPDEEADMRVATAMLDGLIGDYDLGLSVEAAGENGDIVSERKGCGSYTIEVTGHASHAAKELHNGSHAILALAQQTIALQGLNGMRPGVTINVGVIEGGTAENVVPERAKAVIDVRMVDADVQAVEEALARIGQTPYVAGTTSTLTRTLWFPPMPRTATIVELAEIARSSAADLGFDLGHSAGYGVTLANVLAGKGLPTVDGVGPIGGGEHGVDEYLYVPSVVPRTALLALFSHAYAAQFRRA